MIEGEFVEDNKIIKEHIQEFYENLFTEKETWRLSWEDEDLKKLSEEDREWLERPFTLEEVESVQSPRSRWF